MISVLPESHPPHSRDIKTVFWKRHNQIHTLPGYYRVDTEPTWLEVIHDTNSFNRLRGNFLLCSKFNRAFTINWSPQQIPDSDTIKLDKAFNVPFAVAARGPFGRLSFLRQVNDGKKYLEIGDLGWHRCLSMSKFEHLIGVSPGLTKYAKKNTSKKTKFYFNSSDIFFAEYAQFHAPFDCITLGESRDFDKTLTVFQQCLNSGHSKTIVILENTVPASAIAAIPDYDLHQDMRQKNPQERRKSWMGDNYKLAFIIHDLFPQLSYATFAIDSQTVVWHQERHNVVPRWGSLEAIAQLTYDDFLGSQDIMNIQEDFRVVLKQIDYDLNGEEGVFQMLTADG